MIAVEKVELGEGDRRFIRNSRFKDIPACSGKIGGGKPRQVDAGQRTSRKCLQSPSLDQPAPPTTIRAQMRQRLRFIRWSHLAYGGGDVVVVNRH